MERYLQREQACKGRGGVVCTLRFFPRVLFTIFRNASMSVDLGSGCLQSSRGRGCSCIAGAGSTIDCMLLLSFEAADLAKGSIAERVWL